MNIRNINIKLWIVEFFILIGTFTLYQPQINAQNQVQQSSKQLLTSLLNQIEQQMLTNNQDILTNNLTHASSGFDNIKSNLKVLIDVFMPLAERLKALQKQEKTILNKTQNLEDQYIPLTPKDQKIQNQIIIQEQLITRNDTQKTRDIIIQQKNAITANNNAQSKPQPKTIDTVIQLSEYINQALKNENQALNHLHNSQLKQAISEEKKALEQIEKALKLISPPNNQKQKQDQQANNNQKQKQDQQAKKDQKGQKQSSDKKADQQLSAEEALKILAQLQKKAEDERKKREEKYGVKISPQQLPVEKDW